jgi:glutathione transport system substrate-binding protein
VIGIAEDFTTLDPHNAIDNLSLSAERMMTEGLFGFDRDMHVVPVLAEEYEVTSDAKLFTITLKRGIKFHDGTDFNAAAVKASFDRVTNPDNKLRRYVLFSNIQRTEVVDDYTVKLSLAKPFASMINVLAHPAAAILSPTALAQYGKEISRHPVGTGPYKFVEWRPSEHLKVTRNENYWRRGWPKVDTITLRPIPENGTRVATLLSGETQFIYPMAPEQVASVEGKEGCEVQNLPSIFVQFLGMNQLKKPFSDLRVRQALNYALNKKALAKVVYSGLLDPLESTMAPGVEFYARQGTWEYDPEKAKTLLVAAGYPQGFETEIWGPNTSNALRQMQFVQQQFGLVGVKVKVVPMEPGQRVEKMLSVTPETAEVQLYNGGWSPSTGEADWSTRPLFATESFPPKSNNQGFYSNPRVDELIQQGLATIDHVARQKIYGEIQNVVWNDAAWVFIGIGRNLSAKAKRLEGVYLLPDQTSMYAEAELK